MKTILFRLLDDKVTETTLLKTENYGKLVVAVNEILPQVLYNIYIYFIFSYFNIFLSGNY